MIVSSSLRLPCQLQKWSDKYSNILKHYLVNKWISRSWQFPFLQESPLLSNLSFLFQVYLTLCLFHVLILGSHTILVRKKMLSLHILCDRISKKVHEWSATFLSQAGKLWLNLLCMLFHYTLCPVSFYHGLWFNISIPSSPNFGGTPRDLEAFNLARLAKQGWKLISAKITIES